MTTTRTPAQRLSDEAVPTGRYYRTPQPRPGLTTAEQGRNRQQLEENISRRKSHRR